MATRKPGAVDVDLQGLRQMLARRGKTFALLELLSNCWDENVTTVAVTAESIARGRVRLVVEDDAPEGFHDLSHAYTLFAPSRKKNNAEQRGRFNLGDKLVIALTDEFTVETTTGGVVIDVTKNERRMLRRTRPAGSRVTADLKMTQEELTEALATLHTVLAPPTIVTTINGEVIAPRQECASFKASLATEIADAEGNLRPTRRMTRVEVYEPREGETATLYEMGIPVVETGDRWHINVQQKVPLNTDRDNVTPAYLRDLRALVLNAMAERLTETEASATWVAEALDDELMEPEAVTAVLTARFGEKRVVMDPSDLEANRSALAAGYTVIPSNTFSKSGWGNVRHAGAAPPAGQVFPSPKPFSPNGKPLKVKEWEEQTEGERAFVATIERLHADLVGRPVRVVLANDSGWKFEGAYGQGLLYLNARSMTLDVGNERTMTTVLHEFGHAYGEHLTHAFDEGIAAVAARCLVRMRRSPGYL